MTLAVSRGSANVCLWLSCLVAGEDGDGNNLFHDFMEVWEKLDRETLHPRGISNSNAILTPIPQAGTIH